MSAVDLEKAIIVVVEDDPNSFLATIDLLKMEGAESVHGCNSSSEAIALIEALPHIDLFLLDIYMPGETGYDLIERIRAQPHVRDSKVVALTASVMYDDIRRMLDTIGVKSIEELFSGIPHGLRLDRPLGIAGMKCVPNA